MGDGVLRSRPDVEDGDSGLGENLVELLGAHLWRNRVLLTDDRSIDGERALSLGPVGAERDEDTQQDGAETTTYRRSTCREVQMGSVLGSGGTSTVSGRGVGGPTRSKVTGSVRSPPESVRRFPFTLNR